MIDGIVVVVKVDLTIADTRRAFFGVEPDVVVKGRP
jgi:hypothetical protein